MATQLAPTMVAEPRPIPEPRRRSDAMDSLHPGHAAEPWVSPLSSWAQAASPSHLFRGASLPRTYGFGTDAHAWSAPPSQDLQRTTTVRQHGGTERRTPSTSARPLSGFLSHLHASGAQPAAGAARSPARDTDELSAVSASDVPATPPSADEMDTRVSPYSRYAESLQFCDVDGTWPDRIMPAGSDATPPFQHPSEPLGAAVSPPAPRKRPGKRMGRRPSPMGERLLIGHYDA